MEREYLPLFEKYGLGTTIWSPLASGILTGKYNDGIPQDSRMNVEGYDWLKKKLQSPQGQAKIEKTKKLAKLASDLEITTGQLSIAWCLRNPRVSTVILGASRVQQLAENLKALRALPLLTEEVLQKIETIVSNRPEPETDFTDL
jgi:aryl-alcohol dehydrogenase-like predicted oxidoreductase